MTAGKLKKLLVVVKANMVVLEELLDVESVVQSVVDKLVELLLDVKDIVDDDKVVV